MKEIILILCLTFLLVLAVYCMLPIKKMRAINEALKSLLQVLPITKIVEACITYFKSKNASKEEGRKDAG